MPETETDGVAAMLALGERLRWVPKPTAFPFYDVAKEAGQDGATYTVYRLNTESFYRAKRYQHWADRSSPRKYKTSADAKFACQIHAATGKWELD